MDVKITLPLLPLRDIVVFPSMVIPLFVGRDKSISALNEVMKKDKKIILVTQKNSEIDDPKKTDIFMYGCEGSILQLLKLPDGTVKVLVEGIKRVKILDFKDNDKFITCDYAHYNDVIIKEEDLFQLATIALRRLEKLTSINKKVSSEIINTIKKLKDPSQIADNIASHINATILEKQQIFETVDVKKRLNAIIKIMENETSIIGVEKRIRGRVKTQMEKTQREYYLNEQLKAIQKELGEIEDGKDETTSLNKAITKAKMPKEVEKKCLQELKKLKNMSPMSAEATVVRNYLDWMIDLPWHKKSEVDIDLTKALNILDKDHFGLEKVKERIIEFLAVQKRMEKIKGPILCLVGPPGVGKTSLGKSIAKATNREFVRMSVGGMRDEAEIRGYTKESGVRNLEREISKLARKVVKKVIAGEEKEVNINNKNLSDFLGVAKFKFGELEPENRVGIVTGLAWTEYGGEILKIETVTMPGKGRMQITGKLGDVMQESVKAAKSFVRSKCLEYGIIPPLFENKDFHIHVPEGATPKDGPSAGIGMVTSIVSSITGIPIRRDVAMTGEVTLTGQVIPIGGLKEKLLAAHRAGIKEVLIPKENEKDLVDMPKKIIDDIKIIPVDHADQVLKFALTKELKKTEWVEVDISKKDDKSQASIQ